MKMKQFDSLPMFLTEDDLVDFWYQYFQEHPKTDRRVQLYIHYPWCKSICKFCVFGQCMYEPDREIINDYERAVIRQLDKLNRVFNIMTPDELYFGGGTASLWKPISLKIIRDVINCYHNIPYRVTEIHPMDLTDDRIWLYGKEMRMNRVSIGVQSFDRDSCLKQNRVPANIGVLQNAVSEFHKFHTTVNIDLIAMLNGSTDVDWNIFQKDLEIARDTVKPDEIFVEPNFKSDDFYKGSIQFRKILKEFISSSGYNITNPDALSLDYEDIIRYRDLPYELTSYEAPQISTEKFMDERKDEIIIGLGGLNDFTAYSKTPENFYINAKYIPQDKEFVYTLTKHAKFTSTGENDLYNDCVHVGSYTMQPPKRLSE